MCGCRTWTTESKGPALLLSQRQACGPICLTPNPSQHHAHQHHTCSASNASQALVWGAQTTFLIMLYMKWFNAELSTHPAGVPPDTASNEGCCGRRGKPSQHRIHSAARGGLSASQPADVAARHGRRLCAEDAVQGRRGGSVPLQEDPAGPRLSRRWAASVSPVSS